MNGLVEEHKTLRERGNNGNNNNAMEQNRTEQRVPRCCVLFCSAGEAATMYLLLLYGDAVSKKRDQSNK